VEGLCDKILGLDSRVLSVIITDRASGNVLGLKVNPAVASASQHKTNILSMYERILRGLTDKVGEMYETCNFMVFSFSQAHTIILLLERIVILVNAKLEIPLDVIPKIKRTAEEYVITFPGL